MSFNYKDLKLKQLILSKYFHSINSPFKILSLLAFFINGFNFSCSNFIWALLVSSSFFNSVILSLTSLIFKALFLKSVNN